MSYVLDRRVIRLGLAMLAALLVALAARAGEEPLSINEGPLLAPGIAFSPPGAGTPISVEVWRYTLQGEPGTPPDRRLAVLRGPWNPDQVSIDPKGSRELRRSFSGMGPEVAIYFPRKSGELFVGFVDREVRGLWSGLYGYSFVFRFAKGRTDTLDGGQLEVYRDGWRFVRAGIARGEARD